MATSTDARRAARAAATRERILQGALRAFADGGYRGTSVPAIAAEAGVSVGLIYRYFESKAELFLSMCEQETAARLEELVTELGEISAPDQRLRQAVARYVEAIPEGWGALLTNAWAEADLDPRLRVALDRRSARLRVFASRFIAEAIADQRVPASLIEQLSVASIMVLDGAVAHHAERGERFDPGAVTDAITTVLGRALQPPTPRKQNRPR